MIQNDPGPLCWDLPSMHGLCRSRLSGLHLDRDCARACRWLAGMAGVCRREALPAAMDHVAVASAFLACVVPRVADQAAVWSLGMELGGRGTLTTLGALSLSSSAFTLALHEVRHAWVVLRSPRTLPWPGAITL